MTTANLEKGIQFEKFVPFTKMDEATRTVWGLVTSQMKDRSGERCHYETTKPCYQKWCTETAILSEGVSIGTMRAMHKKKDIGRFVKVLFDDKDKQIWMAGTVADDAEWEKCQKGEYNGFSHGGRYVKRWTERGDRWYTGAPKEVSIVSEGRNCNPEATFAYVKMDGSSEMRKFSSSEQEVKTLLWEEGTSTPCTVVVDGQTYELRKDAKTKRVAGKDLPSSDFAFVGDPEKTATWKLPIHDASHIRNALARFNQTQGIPEGEKSKVLGRIKAKAKELGIGGSDDAGKVAKSLYDVGDLADVITRINWISECLEYEREYEGDDSTVPDQLDAAISQLCEILLALAEEETSELTAEDVNKSTKKENQAMSPEETKKMADLEKANTELTEKLAKAAPSAAAAVTDPKDERIAKLEGEVVELNKSFEALNEGLQKLLAVPDKPAIVANPAAKEALGKSTDTGAGDVVVDFEKMSTVDQIKYQQARGKPELPFRPLN